MAATAKKCVRSLSVSRIDTYEPKVDLVHQSRRLKGVAWSLSSDMRARHPAQLRMHQRHELVERRDVSLAPGPEQLGDVVPVLVAHCVCRHSGFSLTSAATPREGKEPRFALHESRDGDPAVDQRSLMKPSCRPSRFALFALACVVALQLSPGVSARASMGNKESKNPHRDKRMRRSDCDAPARGVGLLHNPRLECSCAQRRKNPLLRARVFRPEPSISR